MCTPSKARVKIFSNPHQGSMTDADRTCREPLLLSPTGTALPTGSWVLLTVFSAEHRATFTPGARTVPFAPFHLERVRGRHDQRSPKACAAKVHHEDVFNLTVCSLPRIAHTLLNKEKGESTTQASQRNSLLFEQGSGGGRA